MTIMAYVFHMVMHIVLLLGQDDIECQWTDFTDQESGVQYYQFGIGRAVGDDSIYTYERVEPSLNEFNATGKHWSRYCLVSIL